MVVRFRAGWPEDDSIVRLWVSIPSLDQLADGERKLMDRLAISEADVYGASYGGAIAQHVALNMPDRVRYLALITTFAKAPREELAERATDTEQHGMEAQVARSIILIDGRKLKADIVRSLERIAGMAAGLGLGGPALASISLEGVEDAELTRARPGGRRIRRPAIILQPIAIEDLEAPLAGIFHEQFDIIWQASGWIDGSPSFDGGSWAGYVNPAAYGGA